MSLTSASMTRSITGFTNPGSPRTQQAYEEAVYPLFEDPGLARRDAQHPPLPDRGFSNRGGLAVVHDACPVCIRSMSVTSSVTFAGSLTIPTCQVMSRDLYQQPGIAADGSYAPHQEPLLCQSRHDQSDPDRTRRTRV